VVTGGLAFLSHFEDRCDLSEGERGALGVSNEPKTFHRLVFVVAVSIRCSWWLDEQADLFVVADGRGRDIRLFGELSDMHGRAIPTSPSS
jgi:hypothetical protein